MTRSINQQGHCPPNLKIPSIRPIKPKEREDE